MKIIAVKLVDFFLAALFLLAAFDSLRIFGGTELDLPFIAILIALFYVGIAYGLVRSIPQIKYLVYANSIIGTLMVVGIGVISAIKGTFYPPLIIALAIYALSSLYCYHRFKGAAFSSSFGKEAGYFALTVVALFGVLIAGDHYFQWSHQIEVLSGPISIRK